VRIVCLVKQVPRADSIQFDPETMTLRREGVPLVLNAFDAAAVSMAARLKERTGAEVVAMTMGPPQAEEALRTCLSLGADRCVHLSDRVFAVADTIGTSRTLALAVRKLGADVVLCGRKTTDSETWQVPPEVAAFLGCPHLTSVADLEVHGDHVRATRETDDGFETYELDGAAVLSVAYALEAAGSADGPIEVWTASDLVDDVRPNDKRFGQTGSPTRVLAVRDVTPPRAGERAGSAAAAAERIAALLDERRPDPTAWEKPERLGEKPGKSYDCWTLVELVDGRPTRHSLELLAKGRELAGKLGGRNVALVLGADTRAAATEAARGGAEQVVVVEDEALGEYHPELWTAAVRDVVERRRPHVLLIPATANGRDVGPRVAGELELGMTGDCVGLGIDRAGRLIQTKPAYGGNIVSIIMGATTPQLASVRSRMFEPLEPRDVEAAVERHEPRLAGARSLRVVERRPAPARDLDAADVVVCLGPELAEEDVAALAALGGNGVAVGATRELCDRSLLPRNRQIGLYGRPVAPRVLVAAGVPCDFEQATGFVKAAVVAAVSSGEDSRRLAAADVTLVGEPRKLVPQLLDHLQRR
jgi:electron transfer flavoprotein alpha/beta subunit